MKATRTNKGRRADRARTELNAWSRARNINNGADTHLQRLSPQKLWPARRRWVERGLNYSGQVRTKALTGTGLNTIAVSKAFEVSTLEGAQRGNPQDEAA